MSTDKTTSVEDIDGGEDVLSPLLLRAAEIAQERNYAAKAVGLTVAMNRSTREAMRQDLLSVMARSMAMLAALAAGDALEESGQASNG